MDMPRDLTLPSGLTIHEPVARLHAFCDSEYPYYDGITSTNPWAIEPIDVLATIAENAFLHQNVTAALIRTIHRALHEQCDVELAHIPEHAAIESFAGLSDPCLPLLASATKVRGVSLAVATKVLHRKRRELIPMLDSEIMKYYEGRFKLALGQSGYLSKMIKLAHSAPELPADIRRAAEVMSAFRDDLVGVHAHLAAIQQEIASQGYTLSRVRILELLIWMEVEPWGVYRSKDKTSL